MNKRTARCKFFLLFILGALFIGFGGAACSRAPTTTDLLLQSGFQAEPVKSPAHLQKLPRKQFVIVHQPVQKTYVYTDPRKNQLYFGSETAYLRYRAKAAQAMVKEAPQSSQQSMSPGDWEMYSSLHGVGP
jgi:hypothetical protein